MTRIEKTLDSIKREDINGYLYDELNSDQHRALLTELLMALEEGHVRHIIYDVVNHHHAEGNSHSAHYLGTVYHTYCQWFAYPDPGTEEEEFYDVLPDQTYIYQC